jgi:hypothetical protein
VFCLYAWIDEYFIVWLDYSINPDCVKEWLNASRIFHRLPGIRFSRQAGEKQFKPLLQVPEVEQKQQQQDQYE